MMVVGFEDDGTASIERSHPRGVRFTDGGKIWRFRSE
jgi:hypothetical protein